MQVNSVHGVICGTGLPITQTLVPEQYHAKLGYAPVLKNVANSLSHIYAFVGLEGEPPPLSAPHCMFCFDYIALGTSEELKLRGANLWRLPTNPEPEPNHYLGNAITVVSG